MSTIRELRAALLARRVSPVELVRAALARIEREDPVLRAWVHVDAKAALAAAEAADVARGPLAGIPFGVKDVIDVRGMPTRHGIRTEHARPAVADAWCVAAVRAAGAIPIGKVATTPYAFRDPPAATRNPWDHARTPGGSSAGSAASVGARHVPFSFGTQTGGSTLRPAAYNGVVGLITTLGKIPTVGVQPLAPTLDRVGIMCRTVADATTLLGVYDPAIVRAPTPKSLRIGFARSFQDSVVDAAVAKVIDQALAGFSVEVISLPAVVVEGAVHWEDIMCYEVARLLRPSLGEEAGSTILAASLKRGAAIGYPAYADALAYRERARAELDQLLSNFDVIAHAAAGSPPDRSTTGHTQLPLSWPPTALGLPAITVPVGLTPERLPVGLQLVRRHGEDAQLLAAARFVEEAVPFSADPLRL
ncbi:MAG TPA: amidase [Burkholderiales bacterium]|nr:amidase [Burkholderiales bacterium]